LFPYTTPCRSGGVIDQIGNAILTGGTLANNGTVNITGTGNAWTNENVTANNLLDVQTGGALSITGSTVANTPTTGDGPPTGASSTLSGRTITNDPGGVIDQTGGGILQNGTLVNNGQVNVSGSGNLYKSETVTNTGGQVTVSAASTLGLVNSSILGGTLGGPGSIVTGTGNTDST